MSVYDTVVAVRQKYGPVPSPEELGQIVNEVAWIHRAEGYGLSAKPFGYAVPQPTTGVRIASDILHHRPTDTLYDVLINAGASATPAFNVAEHHRDPNRPWVAPVEPGSVTQPEPNPEPAPCVCACQPKLDEIIDRLDQLGDQLYETAVVISQIQQTVLPEVAKGNRLVYKGRFKAFGIMFDCTLTPSDPAPAR